MMCVGLRHALFVAFVASLGFATLTASADWPSPRQNPKRTAWVEGSSNIQNPAPYWRFYAGGTIGVAGVLAYDVNAGGSQELIVVTGGRVAARDPADGQTAWVTPLLGVDSLVGMGNLDGAGGPELVARSGDRVFVLDPGSGAVLWAEPKGEMGTLGTALVADLDGDGADDVVVQECGCCGVQSGNPGFAYRFSGGAASLTKPSVMWVLPEVSCGPATAAVALHMRSAAQTEFVNALQDKLTLLDGSSGTQIAELGGFGSALQTSNCAPVDVDDDGREELLCAMKDLSAAPGDGRRLYLVRYQAGQLVLAWQQLVGQVERALQIPPGWVVDLDDDGSFEVAAGGRATPNQPITVVYDADTGAHRVTIPGHEPAGTVVLGSGVALLLTRTSGDLHGWSVQGGNAQHLWSLPDRDLVADYDLPLRRRAWVAGRVVTYDVNGDGIDEILTRKSGLDADLQAHDVSSGAPVTVASYAPPALVSLLTAWRFARGTEDQLVIAQSDGNLHELTPAWEPLTGNKAYGVRFGNYSSTGTFRLLRGCPVVASLDGGPLGLLTDTSRGTLERLDATTATFAVGPQRLWQRPATTGAVIAPNLGAGNPGIFAIDAADPERHHIVALRPDGSTIWDAELPGLTLTDLVYGDVDRDGVSDVFTQWGSSFDGVEQTRVILGASGQALWNVISTGEYTRQPAGGAVADWNGDGVDDFIHHTLTTQVRSGSSGQIVAQSELGLSYNMPVIHDVDDDGDEDVTLTAGYEPLRTLEHDLQTKIWQGSEDDRPLTYGTIVQCAGRAPRLVHGSWQFPSRLKAVELSGPAPGSNEVVVLAGGGIYATEAEAAAAGAEGGQLGSPTGHANLGGDGRPQIAVGSTDGWLYLVDPCTLELRHALYFDAQVGAAVFGDTDDDGYDEIIVSVADGYLYGIKQAPVPPPAEVLDIDPPRGIVDEDVDEIETESTLYARWTAVEGADSYEVAVVRAEIDGGGFVSDGPWIEVGAVTAATIESLPLEQGRRYIVAVRALAKGDRSPDTLSDGVVVHKPGAKPGEASVEPVWLVGRSCVYLCATSRGTDGRGAVALYAALAAIAWLRRRAIMRAG